MYIVKPQKGFVIPVEYMINEKLYKDGINSVRCEERESVINLVDSERDNILNEKGEILDNSVGIYSGTVSDRLLDEDDDNFNENYNVITAILEEKEKREEGGSGILIFDDVIENNDIEIDDIKSMELDKARGNLRKAIEVEIEKVGKLVLDDSETEIDSKVSVKSANVQIDNDQSEDLEENIVTDEAREEIDQVSADDVPTDNDSETEAVDNSTED